MESVVNIAVPTPLRRTFDYLLPSNLQCRPGCRVTVPFGRQTLTGLVTEVKSTSEFPLAKLKPIIEVLDQEPLLSSSDLALLTWCADYYHHSLGDVMAHAIPTLLRKGAEPKASTRVSWHIKDTQLSAETLSRAAQQKAAYEQLLSQGSLDETELKQLDIKKTTLKALVNKDLIIEKQQPNWVKPHPATHSPVTVTSEQQTAIDACKTNSPLLLEGITGSGKTEVYLAAIEHQLSLGKQALVLVPEIGLTPQTLQRFQQRFNVPVVSMHSGLNDRERLNAWLQIQCGDARILIGTRSAIFTPMPELGIIVIDEEHDQSYKQQDGLRYSARDVAVKRANLLNIPVILGTATPSLETLHNALSGRYQHKQLTQRPANIQSPSLALEEMRKQPLYAGLTTNVVQQIQQRLNDEQQVLIFLNRRGFAPSLMCEDCGWLADCRRCDARLTLHRNPPHLHCHHCDYQQGLFHRCPDCQSQHLLPLGQGTERSEDELKQLFPDTEIIRVDRDSTSTKQGFHDKLEQIHEGKAGILIGTQMLAKGHHFPKVGLVVVMDADGGLFSSDFRAMEKTAQLITQVAGRAGRDKIKGHVIIQTHQSDNPILKDLVQLGYGDFARDILIERQSFSLPPFGHLALFRAESSFQSPALEWLQQCKELLVQIQAPLQIIGPIPAPMEKRAGKFRYQLLLQSNNRGPLHQSLRQLLPLLEKLKGQHRLHWSLDIDPQDMY